MTPAKGAGIKKSGGGVEESDGKTESRSGGIVEPMGAFISACFQSVADLSVITGS